MNEELSENQKPEESNGSGAYYFTRWLGALFLYLLNFGRKPFSQFDQRKHATRNLIMGYLLTIGAIVVVAIVVNLIVL